MGRNDLAWAFRALGRDPSELLDLLEPERSLWFAAAQAVATGDLVRAADLYAEIGSVPDEAFARMHAARDLIVAGRTAEGADQLARARAFFERVGATGFLSACDDLLAA
jgi:hypothetical protein